jgi:hypothetical protein
MKTITAIRNAFWDVHTEFKSEFRKTYRQSQYRTDIRCAFVDYVDNLRRNEDISEKLANRATL